MRRLEQRRTAADRLAIFNSNVLINYACSGHTDAIIRESGSVLPLVYWLILRITTNGIFY